MSIAINYKNITNKIKPSNVVLFVDEKFNLSSLKKYILNSEYLYISDLLRVGKNKDKIATFEISSKKKFFLVSVKTKFKISEAENLGAKFYEIIKDLKQYDYNVNLDTLPIKSKNFAGYFLHGLKLKSYCFEKYKTKKNKKKISITLSGKNKISANDQIKFRAIEEGTFYTRDLVSEPGNILHPDEYARRLKLLSKDGLKINIYDEKKLKKLGMEWFKR